LAGYLFTMTFSYNLMMSSIIRKLYAFNARFASEITKKKKKKDQIVDEKKKDEDRDEEDGEI